MSAIPNQSNRPHPPPHAQPAPSRTLDEATTIPASSDAGSAHLPDHPRPSPVRLYTTQRIERDRVEHIVIPHGCVGVIETPNGFGSPLFAGEHSTEMLALRGLNAFWLHTVWNRPVPLYLDVRGRSRDGWRLAFTLQAIVEVIDPVGLVQLPNPEQNLRGFLISIALQVVGRYTARELNGESAEIHLGTILQAIRQLCAEEMAQGVAVPGLALHRLDIIRPWPDTGLDEHLRKLALQGRLETAASPSPDPAPAPSQPTPEETADDAVNLSPPTLNAAASPPIVPDLSENILPDRSQGDKDQLERVTALVEAVVRGLVKDGHLRLPNKRREALSPGETLDQAAVSHLETLVANAFIHLTNGQDEDRADG